MSMRKLLATLGGAGMIRFAPGTWGSAVAAILAGAALRIVGPSWAGQSIALLIGIAGFSILSVLIGRHAEADFGKKDPGSFVLDEAAGICLTLLFLPAATGWILVRNVAIGFAAFRLFDIIKLPPARQLEHLPEGWGILADDLAAAIYANVVCQAVIRMML